MNRSSGLRPSPVTWRPAWTVGFVLLLVAAIGSFWIDAAVVGWVWGNVWPFAPGGIIWISLGGTWLGKYGDWPELMLIGFLLWAWARWRGSHAVARLVLIMMASSTLAGITVNTLRLTTGRARPSNLEVQGWVGPVHEGQLTIGRHRLNSFPSGHTATAFGFFGPLLFTYYWRLGLWLLPIPAAIGIARIATLSHHPSDVLWASGLALLTAAACVMVATRRGWFVQQPSPQ